MMKKLIILIIFPLLMLVGPVKAQEANTLDSLLELVKQGRISESKEQKKRIADFQAKKNQQQKLLANAKADREALERRSLELENQFNNNEEQLITLTDQLNKKLGSLRELFGVLQGAAGDTRGKFENSIISAQYPGRSDFLDELAKKAGTSADLPEIDEIERLVYELQREMTESGKISRFTTDVSLPNGELEEREVVRVGSFNLISGNDYLFYEPKTGVKELLKQPASHFTSSASDLSDAEMGDGAVAFGLDPTKGQILGLLVDIPNLIERIQQGSIVGYIIIVVGLIALFLAIQRLYVLSNVGRKVSAQMNSKPHSNNPLGRVLMVQSENKKIDTETLELKLNEAILKETPDLMKFVNLLKIIAVVAPLMGLLGTVTGMIQTFQAITLFGTGDPKVMAGGISQALVTTVLGLCVAIPITLLHSIVNSRSKNIIHVLEEQSAGIIASHNERTQKA